MSQLYEISFRFITLLAKFRIYSYFQHREYTRTLPSNKGPLPIAIDWFKVQFPEADSW